MVAARIHTFWNDQLYYDPGSRSLRREAFLNGRVNKVEPSVIDIITPPGCAAIDAGAAIGFQTLQLARRIGPTGVVIACEPLPASFRLLRRNLAEARRRCARIAKVITIFGACDQNSTRRSFFAGKRFPERASFSIQCPPPGFTKLQIPTVVLDEIVPCYLLGRRLRVFKNDTEGAEFAVFRGAARLISAHRPLLLFEYWPAGLACVEGNRDAQDLLPWLATLGYTRMLAIDVLESEAAEVTPASAPSFLHALALRRRGWSAGPGTIGNQALMYILAQHATDQGNELLEARRLIHRLSLTPMPSRVAARREWATQGMPTLHTAPQN